MDALELVAKPPKGPPQPVYALIGDDDFLKRVARDALTERLLAGGDPELALSTFPGERTTFAAVRAELDTLPFVGDRRVVVIEAADPFVSTYRQQLEAYVAAPSRVGALVFDCTKKAVPSTSKLAKALPAAAKVACEAPNPNKLRDVAKWAGDWCAARHGKALTADAAEALVERVGATLGLLDRELEKLAGSVAAPEIGPADVDRLVARSRVGDVFRILDAAADDRAAEAFRLLAERLRDGDDELAILGALGYQLRKLAATARLVHLGQPLGPAMDAAGVAKWPVARHGIEHQLRHLGLNRAMQLSDWLVDVNLGLKGGSPLPRRMQLELLLAKFAKPRGGANTPAPAKADA